MARRRRVEESNNVKFKHHFHDVSRTIKLAVLLRQEAESEGL